MNEQPSRAGLEGVREATMGRMTEPVIEMVLDATGFPQYAVRVTVAPDAWRQENGKPGLVRFEVFECGGTKMDGTPIYNKTGWTSSFEDPTRSLDEAERSAWGDVKWDGCVNYDVGTEGVMLHACGPDDIGFFLQAIKRGYDIALDLVGGGL